MLTTHRNRPLNTPGKVYCLTCTAKKFDAVLSALQRIHDKEYGLCIDCIAAIPFKRLCAEPHALRCAACKSRHESCQRISGHPIAALDAY